MLPRERRRRPRRRSVAPALLVGGVILLVLALLVGGVAHIGRASGPYRRDLNRSLADQVAIVATRSDVSGRDLRQLMASMPTLGRERLQAVLDQLASSTAAQASAAAVVTPPAPPAPAAASLPAVFSARAAAIAAVRLAVDGLLHMSPSPVAGSAGPGVPAVPALGTAQAAGRMAAAGLELERADAAYAAARRALAAGAGHARLPVSQWITDPRIWTAGAVDTLVDELVSSPSLAPSPHLVLRTVRLAPAAVPSPTGQPRPGGASTVPPTRTLSVGAVVANEGNVTERGIRVTVTVAGPAGRPPVSTGQTIALVPGASVSLDFDPLPVSPGRTYVLTVAIVPRSPQRDSAALSERWTIDDAAPTPPSTTTTVPATTTSRPAA